MVGVGPVNLWLDCPFYVFIERERERFWAFCGFRYENQCQQVFNSTHGWDGFRAVIVSDELKLGNADGIAIEEDRVIVCWNLGTPLLFGGVVCWTPLLFVEIWELHSLCWWCCMLNSILYVKLHYSLFWSIYDGKREWGCHALKFQRINTLYFHVESRQGP